MISAADLDRKKVYAMISLDRLDVELLGALEHEPRLGVMELSTRLGVARNTVQARMKRLEDSGAVISYAPQFDLESIGLPIQAFLGVELVQGRLQRVVAALQRIPHVLEVHATTGREDLLIRVASATHAELQAVVEQILEIEGVAHTTTTLALTTPVPYRIQPLLEYTTEGAGRGRSGR